MSGSKRNSAGRVHAALLTVATLFSLNYIISKLAMHSFSPLAFAWLRVAGSALLLQVPVRGQYSWSGDDWWRVTRLAILGVVLNQTLFLAGLALTSAYVAAILITAIPVFALGAAIVLGAERATALKIAGIALAGGGALLVIGGQSASGSPTSVLGAVMIVLNCLSYAIYLVISKPLLERLPPVRVIAGMFAVGTVLMFPVSAYSLWKQDWTAIPIRAWLGLALVIAGPTVAAYLLNAWALRHADSSLVAAYTYVQPVMTTILAAVFLGETLRPVVLLAGLLIVAGVRLAGRGSGPIPE